jgi:sugar phosphate isomerase/epimerase
MKIAHGQHLAYCTNIHRGEAWADIFAALCQHTLAVRDRVAAGRPYAIGLRLGFAAARELASPPVLAAFRQWLGRENCYVFTVNGFPFGPFHGTRVKEQVYHPDWTRPERLEYTRLLFGILREITPSHLAASVSTVPVSFKAWMADPAAEKTARKNLWDCVDFLSQLAEETGRDFHLGLEPEPGCHLENTTEVLDFFGRFAADRPGDDRWHQRLGINYDCCHLAIQYETAPSALGRLAGQGIRISKIHLSNALRVQPTPEVRQELAGFSDPVYLHQVVARTAAGDFHRFLDLPECLARPVAADETEWRIHYHIPLHAEPREGWLTTADHVRGVLDVLGENPSLCQHLEMETYTWEVMPSSLKTRAVVDQLAAEYHWTLRELARRGLDQVPA